MPFLIRYGKFDFLKIFEKFDDDCDDDDDFDDADVDDDNYNSL